MQRIRFVFLAVVTSVLVSGWTIAIEPTLSQETGNLPTPAPAPVSVIRDRPTVSDSSYSFTITLPEHTGNQFARLSFSFTNPDRGNEVAVIPFNLPGTQAFVGSPDARGEAIALSSTWIDETGILWVEFNSAVSPKTTLTIVMTAPDPLPNPSVAYSVAAYPDANPAIPVFVGDGTMTNE
jgi:hypothetical protein